MRSPGLRGRKFFWGGGLGIQSTSFSLASQLVTTTGTAPPSSIISSIQSTGRPAILRGSGSPNSSSSPPLSLSFPVPVPPPPHFLFPLPKSNPPTTPHSAGAAVVILSIPPPHPSSTSVRGLIRLIQLTPSLTLLDLSLNSLPPGRYRASLRRGGDISRGAASMGPVFDGTGSGGEWGTVVVTVDERGAGALMGEIGCPVADMVGRGVLVEREREQRDAGSSSGIGSSRQGNEGEQEEDSLVVVGVVARSAGVWENDKVVCACSGKTVWQEREEMRGKGVL